MSAQEHRTDSTTHVISTATDVLSGWRGVVQLAGGSSRGVIGKNYGTFAHKNFRSRERKFLGAKVPVTIGNPGQNLHRKLRPNVTTYKGALY